MVVGVIVAIAVLPQIASSVMTNALGVPVNIRSISLSPFSGDATVKGITIGQPDGFGEEPIISLDAVKVKDFSGVFGSAYEVSELKLENLKLLLINNQDQEFNLLKLVEGLSSEDEEEEESDEGEILALLDSFELDGLEVSFRDYSLGEEGEAFELDMIDGKVEAERIALGAWPELEPGKLEFTAKLEQEGDTDSDIAFYAKLGQLEGGVLDIDSVMRISALRYDTLYPAIPASASVALGGGGLQLRMVSQIANGQINVLGKIETSSNSRYNLAVVGPLESPEVDLPKKLLSVGSRMTGSVGRVFHSAWSGTGEVISGAAGTVATLGKETLGAVGSLAKGAGNSVAGALTGDGEKVQSGLGEATAGTGGHLVGAVKDSTKKLAESGSDTFRAISEDPRFLKWLDKQNAEHEELAEEDKETVEANPFPPQIEGDKDSKKEE